MNRPKLFTCKARGSKRWLLTVLMLSLFSISVPAAHAATYYVATNGSDSNGCSQTQPCASFSRAYAVASGGDTIEVAAGTYGSQSIPSRSIGTAVVTFRPAAGASVTIGSLNVQASYVEVQNMAATSGYSIAPSGSTSLPSATNHVTLRGMSGKYMYIVGENISILGGDYGGFDACDTSYPEDVVDVWQRNGIASSYVTFDGVTIHDVTDHNNTCSGTAGSGRHVDCMQLLAGHYITVRNSQFYNCATSDIIARPYLDTLNDLVLENNFFQQVMHPGMALNLGSSGDTYGGTNIVRYNYIGSFTAGFTSGSMATYGNIMETGACQSGVTYSYNVYTSGAVCGTNAKSGNPTFVGPTPSASYLNGIVPNYHLAATDTLAKDAGDPLRYPATDIDGEPRYSGSAPDAGADEIVSTIAAPLPPTNLRATAQ